MELLQLGHFGEFSTENMGPITFWLGEGVYTKAFRTAQFPIEVTGNNG
jgi:hypothetical protein